MKLSRRIACVTSLVLATGIDTSAPAAPLALPSAPQPEFTQNIGSELPLDTRFADDDGRAVRLADVFGGRSVLLLFGYYHCTMLCGLVAEGVLDALSKAQLSNDAVRVVEVGIDPHETPSDAAQRKAQYVQRFAAFGARMHLLTGNPSAIDALTSAGGFQYAYDAAHAQYIHPAGFLVITPQGRVSRYFFGVHFDPKELRSAIATADANAAGSALDRLLLLCAHYDPSSGRHSAAAMTLVRSVCIAVLAALVAWIAMRRSRRRRTRER